MAGDVEAVGDLEESPVATPDPGGIEDPVAGARDPAGGRSEVDLVAYCRGVPADERMATRDSPCHGAAAGEHVVAGDAPTGSCIGVVPYGTRREAVGAPSPYSGNST